MQFGCGLWIWVYVYTNMFVCMYVYVYVCVCAGLRLGWISKLEQKTEEVCQVMALPASPDKERELERRLQEIKEEVHVHASTWPFLCWCAGVSVDGDGGVCLAHVHARAHVHHACVSTQQEESLSKLHKDLLESFTSANRSNALDWDEFQAQEVCLACCLLCGVASSPLVVSCSSPPLCRAPLASFVFLRVLAPSFACDPTRAQES